MKEEGREEGEVSRKEGREEREEREGGRGRVLKKPQLAADSPVPVLFSNSSSSLQQFILGPRQSGTPSLPLHCYGVKQWYMYQCSALPQVNHYGNSTVIVYFVL